MNEVMYEMGSRNFGMSTVEFMKKSGHKFYT